MPKYVAIYSEPVNVVTKLTAESGPLTAWGESMIMETRQFMALQAQAEAFFILKELTIKWMFMNMGRPERKSPLLKQPHQAGGVVHVESIFAPLLAQIDRQMLRRPANKSEKIIDVPLFSEQVALTTFPGPSKLPGFRRWYVAIRVRKMELWQRLFEKYPRTLEQDWRAAMHYLTRRIELLTTLTLVCIHKNVRGFPETSWMRRYAHFGGGTYDGGDPIDGGEFGVEDLEERYMKKEAEEQQDVEDRVLDDQGRRSTAILVFRSIYGDEGGSATAGNIVNKSPNAGWLKPGVGHSRGSRPLKNAIVMGAGWAMTNGWINNNTFVNAMGHAGRSNTNVVFSEETRWRYGAFPFQSNWFNDSSRHAEIVGYLTERLPGLNMKRLQAKLSDGYMDAYLLPAYGDMQEIRLPSIQGWYNMETGRPYEGAFIGGPLHTYDPEAGKAERRTALSKRWGPPKWLPDGHDPDAPDKKGLKGDYGLQ